MTADATEVERRAVRADIEALFTRWQQQGTMMLLSESEQRDRIDRIMRAWDRNRERAIAPLQEADRIMTAALALQKRGVPDG
jgi:hypothetical protein